MTARCRPDKGPPFSATVRHKGEHADHSTKLLQSSPLREGSTTLACASHYLEFLRSMRSLMEARVGLSFTISWMLSSPKSVKP
jgi:hypothetical protein